MAKPSDHQHRAGQPQAGAPGLRADSRDWEVSCPEGDSDGHVYDRKAEAQHAAKKHNARFTPRHHADIRVHVEDPQDPPPPHHP